MAGIYAADGSQNVTIVAGSSSGSSTGNVAAGATDSGNPVKVGGKYNLTPPTLADGERGDLQLDSKSRLIATTQGGVAAGATDDGSNPNKIATVYHSAGVTYTDGQRAEPQVDANGRILIGDLRANGALVQTGVDNADAIAASGTSNKLRVVAEAASFNGTTWDRTYSGGDSADAVATGTVGRQLVSSRSYGFNGTTWDRLQSSGDNADAQATGTVGRLLASVRNMGFNGTTWDRLRVAATGLLRVRNEGPTLTARLPSSAATTNATSVTATPTLLYKITAVNNSASGKTIKVYNKASAPTVGTDTPLFSVYVPVSSLVGMFQYDIASGQLLSTGFAYATTALNVDSDTTALASGDLFNVTFHYTPA